MEQEEAGDQRLSQQRGEATEGLEQVAQQAEQLLELQKEPQGAQEQRLSEPQEEK